MRRVAERATQIDIANIDVPATPRYPAHLKGKGHPQARAVNEQRYYFARSGMFGKVGCPAGLSATRALDPLQHWRAPGVSAC